MTLASDLASAKDIDGLIAAIEKQNDLVDRVAKHTEEKLVAVVDEQFATETDPDGKHWQGGPSYHGLISPGGGEMLGSLSIKANGSEIEMSMDDPFRFHQHGTKKMPQRKIFPDEGEPLPPKYQAAIDEAFEEIVGK